MFGTGKAWVWHNWATEPVKLGTRRGHFRSPVGAIVAPGLASRLQSAPDGPDWQSTTKPVRKQVWASDLGGIGVVGLHRRLAKPWWPN